MAADGSTQGPGRAEPWLVALALALIVGLQEGTLADPLGRVGQTRVADWLDLLVPWAILGPAAMVLAACRPRPAAWWVFGAGALVLVQGHGIHLAANSIAKYHSSDTVYLWDEIVGHQLLFGGVGLMLAGVFAALNAGPRLRVGPVGWLLGVVVGVSLFNCYIEGSAPLLGLATSVGFLVWAWRRRGDPHGRLALLTYAITFVLLVGWGAYWQGYPEFSELGWI